MDVWTPGTHGDDENDDNVMDGNPPWMHKRKVVDFLRESISSVLNKWINEFLELMKTTFKQKFEDIEMKKQNGTWKYDDDTKKLTHLIRSKYVLDKLQTYVGIQHHKNVKCNNEQTHATIIPILKAMSSIVMSYVSNDCETDHLQISSDLTIDDMKNAYAMGIPSPSKWPAELEKYKKFCLTPDVPSN